MPADDLTVADRVAAVIDRLGSKSAEVIELIDRRLISEIIELHGDAQLLELLRGSTTGNVETVFDALRYDIDIERVEPPTAALEYARRLAQRGIPVNALVRAYRLGQQEMLVWVGNHIREADVPSAAALDVFDAISQVTFRYIDWISQQVIAVYEAERVRWVENRSRVRAMRVRELLSATGEPVDIDAASEAVHYPLRGAHLAVILWTDTEDATGNELVGLERHLRRLADALGLRDAPLFVAADRVCGWGWLPIGGNHTDHAVERIRSPQNPPGEQFRVAIGTVGRDIDGFRQSHQDAHYARRVALTGPAGRQVVAASDPGVIASALLAQDLTQTRQWVSATLGPLANDTESDARLRDTLRVFLGAGASYKAAAEQLSLHHNSVKYRIDRAIERRGRPIDADRIDVELALMACYHLGTDTLIS